MVELFGPDLVLLDRLACGGMGEIFRAKQIGEGGFQKTVAVKRIHPHIALNDRFKMMFEREMFICAKLHHPNIVQIYNTGEVEGRLHLVMEMVEGQDIGKLIERAKSDSFEIPIPIACHIVASAALGLHHAHTQRDEITDAPIEIVHRDVSPHNIMVSYEGEVKIIDFGIAKAAGSVDLSVSGDLLGKARYISPEHLEGEKLDCRSDIFSLGLVLYELLTLKGAFSGEQTFESLVKVRRCDIPPIRRHRPEIPEALARIVHRAVEREREDRYSSADQLHRELSQLIRASFPDFSPDSLREFMRRRFADERQRAKEDRVALSLSLSKSDSEIRAQRARAKSGTAERFGSGVSTRRRAKIATMGLGLSVMLVVLTIMTIGAPKRTQAKTIDGIPGVIAWFNPSTIDGFEPVKRIDGRVQGVAASQIERSRYPGIATVNGRNMLSFDGIDDFLTADEVAVRLRPLKAFSIVAVAASHSEGSGAIWSVQLHDRSTDIAWLAFSVGGKMTLKGGPNKNYITSEPIERGVTAIYTTIVERKSVTVYRNGRKIISYSLTQPLPISEAGSFSLGQEFDYGSPSDQLRGYLGDVVVVSDALPEKSRRIIERRLASRYSIDLEEH